MCMPFEEVSLLIAGAYVSTSSKARRIWFYKPFCNRGLAGSACASMVECPARLQSEGPVEDLGRDVMADASGKDWAAKIEIVLCE